MKVFLSWSGDRSKALADALAPWLRQVIQAIDPWVSTDIRKGARWGPEISEQLELTKVGIICLTRDNLTEPWILFEAGALSKTKDAYVCTMLLDLAKTDVEPPLAQFQHTTVEQNEVRQLVHNLNALVRTSGGRALPEADLDEVFDLFWPRLEEKVNAIKPFDDVKKSGPVRSDGDILREILEVVRSKQARSEPSGLVSQVSEVASPRFHYRLVTLDTPQWQEAKMAILGLPNISRFDESKSGTKIIVKVKATGPAMNGMRSALRLAGCEAKLFAVQVTNA